LTLTIEEEIVKRAKSYATSNEFKDYEDAVQFQCTITITAINGIIKRKKNFKYSTIPIFAREEGLFEVDF
jgi:hypothetical protein